MNVAKLQRYLDTPKPSIDNPPRMRLVPIILSDSKGRYLRRQSTLPLEHDIVWCDQFNEGGRTSDLGLEWVKSNFEKWGTKYKDFFLFVWLGTCNFCTKNNKYISLKENISREAAKIISDLRQISELGSAHNFPVLLLEIPVFCIQEWNRVHGHKSPADFKEQDELLHQSIQVVNEEIRKINLDKGKVSPLFNLDLRRKRKSSSVSSRRYYSFAQYVDGIHPNHLLSKYWLRKISEVVRVECY